MTALYLMKPTKVDLCQLAKELVEVGPEKSIMLELNKLILQSNNYDEEVWKLFKETINVDRKEWEEQKKIMQEK